MLAWALLLGLVGCSNPEAGSGSTPDVGESTSHPADPGDSGQTSDDDDSDNPSETSSSDDEDTASSSSGGPEEDVWPRPLYVSGTRLRAVTLNDTAGAVFDHWFDASLDIDCTPETTTGGLTRCVPRQLRLWSELPWFSDPQCTAPALVLNECSAGPGVDSPRFAVFECPDCPTVEVQRVHRFGAPMPVETVYVRDAAGGCDAIAGSVSLLPLAEEVPLEEWVSFDHEPASLESAPEYEAVTAFVQRSEDGSRRIIGPYDRAFESSRLELQQTADAVRWVPRDVPMSYYSSYRQDARCEVDLTIVEPEDLANGDPRLVSRFDTNYRDCSWQTFYDVGPRITITEPVHQATVGGQCLPNSYIPAPEDTVFEVGAERPLGVAIRMEETLGTTTAIRWGNEQGQPLQSLHLRDEARNVACTPTATQAGIRCLPQGALVSPFYFEDPQCTVPVATMERTREFELASPTPPCEPQIEPTFATGWVAGTCGDWVVYTVTGEIDDDTSVYERGGASSPCRRTNMAGNVRGFRVGAVLPITEFPAFELVVDR